MVTTSFKNIIKSEEELLSLIGEPSDLAKQKVISILDHHCTNFIEHSPFMVLSTSNSLGQCDVSPRGDAPGFIKVLNERTMMIPERPGNKRMDSMRNILMNPHVGMLFFIPGLEETLRVNGKATLVTDDELLEQMAVRGKKPQIAIVLEVEECFIHCAKAFKRSNLWEPTTWAAQESLPNAAKIIFEHAKLPGTTSYSIAERLEEGYKNRLY